MASETEPVTQAGAPSRVAHRRGAEVLRHVRTLTQPKLLRRWYRHTFPLATPFFDGRERWTRRGVHRVFGLWLKEQGSTNEAWAAYDHYRGGDVIDVGASEGAFSLLLVPKSRPGVRHLCLEPDAKSFSRLLEHLAEMKRLFPEIDFLPLPQAAGDGKPGLVNVLSGEKVIPTLSVDDLVAFFGLQPDFIKVDVEGYEWIVLQGMEKTLRDGAPVLHLELHPTHLPKETTIPQIESWLRGLGYSSIEVDRGEISIRQIWTRASA